jgi:hypothetical protein
VPERKLAGWDQLAAAVDAELAAAPSGTVTLTAAYDLAAELAWHNRRHPRPICINLGRRMHQYDLWGGLDARHAGRDAIFASEIARDGAVTVPAALAADFASVAAPRIVIVERGGRIWRRFAVVRLIGFDGRCDAAHAPVAF